MLSRKCITSYLKQYPDTEGCGFGEPGNLILITDEKGNSVIEPSTGETNTIFLDRLERSKKTGRNLFFEEWESFEYIEDALY